MEWEDWGPQATRWFGFDDVSQASLSGSRLLGKSRPRITDEVWRGEQLLIFDFNMRALRRHASSATAKEGSSFRAFRTYTGDSELLDAGRSGIDIVSSLSCVATTININALGYSEFLLEDHVIIGEADFGYDVFSFYPSTSG